MEKLDTGTLARQSFDFPLKAGHRKAMRALTFPEKVKRVVELQRIAAPVLLARGRNVRVWPDA